MHQTTAATAVTSTAGRSLGRRPTSSSTDQHTAMKMPIDGMYVYRSAIDCSPTCTSPITGTSVPRYQSQPMSRYGAGRTSKTAHDEIATSAAAHARTCHGAHPAGGGYNTAK